MDNIPKFQYWLLQNGAVGYSHSDAQYLLNVAQLCAKTAGIPAGAAAGLFLAGAGSVTVPGVGAVPGWLVGALAGFVGGTTACVIQRGAMKPALDQLLEDR
jgi:hypothetical protein